MTSRPNSAAHTLVLCVVLLPGCGAKPLPPAADQDQAGAAVRAGLDAWKNGDKAESLQARSPAIYFKDLRWQAGDRLISYAMSDSWDRFGQSVRCSVTLELRDASGNTSRRKATYNIDTDPSNIVIVPADM